MSRQQVTVIGLGPMGQAMVRQFLAAGVEVTVWNRSPEKTDIAVEFGARQAETVAEALDASPVIVVSLTEYAAMYDVLGQAPDRLSGKVIVNLSSDSPENTRRGADWVRAHGGEFLSGGVLAQPEGLAGPEAYVFYSGPQPAFEERADLLRHLAEPEYLGVEDGLAQLYYQAVLAIFLPNLLAYEQALAMIDRSGEPIDRFLPYAQRSMGSMSELYAGVTAMAAAGGTDLAHLRMMDAGAQHVVETSEAVGVDPALAHAVREYWRRALAESERGGEPVPTYQLLRGIRRT